VDTALKDKIIQFVENNIDVFHRRRLELLQNLKFKEILKRKNPYLFKAKHIVLIQDLVTYILNAHLSSQEETLFGAFLEELAIYVNQEVFGGRKSSTTGIDLEFEREGVYYLVSIKSSPNWGNSSQIGKLREDFKRAKQVLRQSRRVGQIEAINGCCSGRDNNPDKGDYFKYCGQLFWKLISGDPQMYVEIIEPLGHRAKEKNKAFQDAYTDIVNRFTVEFVNDFCQDVRIDWQKLVKFNSEAKTTNKKETDNGRK